MTVADRTRWTAVAAAVCAGIVSAAYVGKMPTALPILKSELGLSLLSASWLVSMFNLIALSAAIFFGLATDRLGAFRFCLGGLAAMTAGGLAGAAAPDTTMLLASRVLEGAGFVAIIVSAPALIAAAAAPRERGLALGFWSSYMPAGASVVLALSPLALDAIGWRGLWVAIALATVAVAAWLASHARDYGGVKTGSRRSLADLRGALAQPVPWLLGLVFALYAMQFHVVMVFLPTYLLQTRNAGVTEGALLTALFVAVNIIGILYGSRLVHRNVPRGRMIVATFICIGTLAVGIFSPALPDLARYVCVLAFSMVAGVIPPAVLSSTSRYARSPAEVGAMQGLIVQISNCGVFVGTPLVAAVVTWTGRWESVLFVLLGATAIGLVGGRLIRVQERHAGAAAAIQP